MNSLNIEGKYRVLFTNINKCRLFVVGCGGTGSFLAQNIARLNYFMRKFGKSIEACFIDHDIVTEDNVGRQNFCPADVGKPKAKVLSERYNYAYGWTSSYSVNNFISTKEVYQSYQDIDKILYIIVGAVDTCLSRRSIDAFVHARGGRYWWLDCGNSFTGGQVLIGNNWYREGKANMLTPLGICNYLPLPSIQHPELIDPKHDLSDREQVSCAELVGREQQSLFVNQTVASFAASFLYQMLVKRELDYYATYFDLGVLSSIVKPITLNNLSPYMTKKHHKEISKASVTA